MAVGSEGLCFGPTGESCCHCNDLATVFLGGLGWREALWAVFLLPLPCDHDRSRCRSEQGPDGGRGEQGRKVTSEGLSQGTRDVWEQLSCGEASSSCVSLWPKTVSWVSEWGASRISSLGAVSGMSVRYGAGV